MKLKVSKKDKNYIGALFILLRHPLTKDHRWLCAMGSLDCLLYHKYNLQGPIPVCVFFKNNFPNDNFHETYPDLKAKWRRLVKEELTIEETNHA